MPGTIQVSILELVGLPSVSQSSSMSIKVKVGKQAHEVQDRGDFSFPLASLRDNVNVSIHDSEGNEIAHTAVETRSIVEKGNWDDLFALKGGGHVRMRLLFVLTEDELKRIRSMRESATRKKREDLLKRSRSSSDLAIASGGSPTCSQDSLKATNRAEKQSKNPTDNQVKEMEVVSDAIVLSKDHPVQKRQATPAFSTSKSTGALDKLHVNQHIKEVIQPRVQKKQSPVDKTPNNVRKRILAFETKPVKEALPPISETRAVPQISTAIVDARARSPSLKKTIGANVKPAPILEGSGKEREENRDYGRSMYEEQLVQKSDQLNDLKPPQNVDYMSSKNDIPKMQPTREEQKEEKKALKLQNIDYMPSEKDVPEMHTGEEQKEEKKDLKVESVDDLSSKKEIPKMQPTREEQKEEQKDLELQNIDYLSSKKDVPKMQPTVEELLKLQNIDYVSSKKDIPKVQPAREEKKEEKKDLTLQNINYVPSKKDIPKVQPGREEQKEEKKNLKLQYIDYVSSEKDIPRMQATREELKEETTDLKLGNIGYMSSEKDIPKMQPTREEQKEEKKDLKLQNIDYMSSKKDKSKIQPTREEQNEKQRSPKKLRLSSTAESSRFSWGGLVRAFQSRTQSSPDISTEQQGSPSRDPFVVNKSWRSKHWTSLQCRVKYNKTYGNENYISDRFSDWIFLNEMIHSCIPSDDRPFVDLLQGCIAHCRPESSQGKLADNCVSPDSCEKSPVRSEKLDSGSSPNEGDSGRPIGQAMKIAIMVGFGLLVFLTRQRR